MAFLDTLLSRFYKPRPLWLWAALVSHVAVAEVVNGAQLPDGAQRVAENRYRTAQGFEETLKWYRSVYPPGAYPRKAVINQPNVKAVHIANPSRKGFDGLNIYEANDEVRIFVVIERGLRPKTKERPARK